MKEKKGEWRQEYTLFNGMFKAYSITTLHADLDMYRTTALTRCTAKDLLYLPSLTGPVVSTGGGRGLGVGGGERTEAKWFVIKISMLRRLYEEEEDATQARDYEKQVK